MKIAVSTRLLRSERMTGIEIFTFETMRRVTHLLPDWKFYYIFDRPYEKHFITADNIVPVVIPFRSYYRSWHLHLWFEYILPFYVKKLGVNGIIFPDSTMSLSVKVPALMVLHDINFEHYPQYLPRAISRFYRRYMHQYVHKARRVVTVSEFSRSDIATTYGIPLEKIDVVYNGCYATSQNCNEAEKTQIRQRYSNGLSFFLFVGTIHPRKNLLNQLKAFELFNSDMSMPPHAMVVIGKKWMWDNELDAYLKRMNWKHMVFFYDTVQKEELGKLYASAEALLYVSIFEGFGIPILEAFAAGTPVITSTTTSMPEVAGDAAMFADPHHYEDIAYAMKSIIVDRTLREKLIRKGFERLQLFSWEKTAQLFTQALVKTFVHHS